MEEKQKFEELNSILESIKKVLELYNDLNPGENLQITPQDNRKDVNNVFICVYNDNCVGLFKKINWSENLSYSGYNAGSIYVGIDSDYIGMKLTHSDRDTVNKWEKIGTKVIDKNTTYIANCNMKNGMSFDDMRLIMYSENQIGPYEFGKASSEEMLKVLKYAYSYYKLDQNNQGQKTR